MPSQYTRKLTTTALLAALASALMFISFPLPFLPPFLKLDLSNVPILMVGLLFGNGPAILAALIKDLVNLTASGTGGVGELADFLVTVAFVCPIVWIYQKRVTRRPLFLGCIAGVAAMTVVGMLANRFLLIPFYSKIMPIQAILDACGAVNPLIGDINTYVLFGAGPFNLIKGVVLSVVAVFCYRRLSGLIFGGKGRPARA